MPPRVARGHEPACSSAKRSDSDFLGRGRRSASKNQGDLLVTALKNIEGTKLYKTKSEFGALSRYCNPPLWAPRARKCPINVLETTMQAVLVAHHSNADSSRPPLAFEAN